MKVVYAGNHVADKNGGITSKDKEIYRNDEGQTYKDVFYS
jgi:hypothetical protein